MQKNIPVIIITAVIVFVLTAAGSYLLFGQSNSEVVIEPTPHADTAGTAPQPQEQPEVTKEDEVIETATPEEKPAPETPLIVGNHTTLADMGIKLTYPHAYAIKTSAETGRRGSFVSYEFIPQGTEEGIVQLAEIQAFSKESISSFIDRCDSFNDPTPCFFGDYPDLSRFDGQKNALQYRTNYIEKKAHMLGDTAGQAPYSATYTYLTINGGPFLRSPYMGGPHGIGYEYTTFVGDTKIDIWIRPEGNTAETQKARDELISKINITGL